MKKILFVLGLFFIGFTSVSASNRIYSIDMDIYIDRSGNANITEKWHVNGQDGTEWYKVLNNLGNSTLTNFKVSMDGKELTRKTWDVDESLSEKKGYYGINYTSNGLELCFGKYDYKEHIFTLSYNLSNFVFNTEDSQVLYWTLIDELSDVNFDDFSVEIRSYYSFPDTLDVWGYGYKGYAYVENGVIKMSNESDMDDEYVVLLAKFPLNTFNTTNTDKRFDNFNDVYEEAEEGTFEYNYEITNILDKIFGILSFVFNFFLVIGIPLIVAILASRNKYGYKNNKKINKKEVPMFRDIPCDKDIYYANTLIKLNNFGYKESNILGAIILKWVRENKIVFKKEEGTFGKEKSVIDLTLNPVFDNENERKLFDMMKVASKDGYLETKEFEKWSKNNYSKFFDLFKKIEAEKINELKAEGHIYKRTNKEECKYKNVMDDYIYEDSKQLYGLKLFLEEFSSIDTKEVLEVHLWDEYLMFAYLFGIADKVAKQLKNMYPEVIEQSNIDYDNIVFVSHISTRTVSAASSARSAAQSYSSGGGGFSSGGGGGGSFGGGGGGSR